MGMANKLKIVTMTVWGRFCAAVDSSVNEVAQKFDWANALADAGIMAGVSFFGALGGTAVVGIPAAAALCAAGISALFSFFLFLAGKRGLVKQ
jgi:hypothetical protein